jgi:hypothetical protein
MPFAVVRMDVGFRLGAPTWAPCLASSIPQVRTIQTGGLPGALAWTCAHAPSALSAGAHLVSTGRHEEQIAGLIGHYSMPRSLGHNEGISRSELDHLRLSVFVVK